MSSTVLGLANSYGPIDTLPAADVLALVAALDWLAGKPLSKSLTGLTSPITLSADEYNTAQMEFTGVLTGNVVVEFPVYRRWIVKHSATGGYTITCKVSGLTGVTLLPGTTVFLGGNGTDLVRGGASVTSDGVPIATVADANTSPGLPVLHRIDVPAGATGNVDTVLTYKTRVVEVWLVKKTAAGGGAGTIQVKNGASAITDLMSINVADQTVVRCTTIDDASHEIAQGGTLRITRTRTASADESCVVYILGVLVA
jgi:hypothetical protein